MQKGRLVDSFAGRARKFPIDPPTDFEFDCHRVMDVSHNLRQVAANQASKVTRRASHRNGHGPDVDTTTTRQN